MLALAAESRSQTVRQPSRTLEPPRTNLTAVPLPDLEKLEPDVGEQLRAMQSSLAALAKDPAATAQRLSEAYGLMGQVYQAYALTASAEPSYLNAHRLAPDDFRWLHFLGSLGQQEGRTQEAITYYQRAVQLRSDDLAAQVYLGNLYLQQNQLEPARTSFKAALAINANCAAAWYGFGQLSLASQNYGEAAKQLEQALRLSPETNRIHYALALAYRGLGEIEKARAHLQQQGPVGVRVADPLLDGLPELIKGERLPLVRGRMAFDALRFADAATEFRKAVAAQPASLTARVNLGSALAELGDVDGAIEQFQEALRIEPKNLAAHYNLSLLFAKQNQPGQAIAHLRVVLDMNDRDVEARWRLAQELLKASRRQEALAELARVIADDPNNEDALLTRAKILSGNRQYAQALSELEKSHAQFPARGRTAVMLAYLLAASPQIELRDGARALALGRRIYAATAQASDGVIIALALAEMGRCQEAAAWQRRMVEAAEHDHDADLAAKLKADLRRYENKQPCRPAADPGLPEPRSLIRNQRVRDQFRHERAANQRARKDRPKAQPLTEFPVFFEHLRMDVFRDRQVLPRWLQILADGRHLNVVSPKVFEQPLDFLPSLSQPDHQSRLGQHAARIPPGISQDVE